MNSALASLLATLIAYAGIRFLYGRRRSPWLSPIVLVPAILVAWMVLTHTTYATYSQDTHWLVWMLGPATIAFACPIYARRELIRRYPLTLSAGVGTGLVLGVGSSWLLSRALSLPPLLARSVLSRSVSTPFAVAATTTFGGATDITVVCVVTTGVFGMLIGEGLHTWLGLRGRVARGASLGAAAHGVGTAKAYELGEEEGAVASLTMIFSGIALVLIAPVLAPWLR